MQEKIPAKYPAYTVNGWFTVARWNGHAVYLKQIGSYTFSISSTEPVEDQGWDFASITLSAYKSSHEYLLEMHEIFIDQYESKAVFHATRRTIEARMFNYSDNHLETLVLEANLG